MLFDVIKIIFKRRLHSTCTGKTVLVHTCTYMNCPQIYSTNYDYVERTRYLETWRERTQEKD